MRLTRENELMTHSPPWVEGKRQHGKFLSVVLVYFSPVILVHFFAGDHNHRPQMYERCKIRVPIQKHLQIQRMERRCHFF